MTFSIAGFCRQSGEFGAAISSSSICVASRCPFVAAGTGVVLTQNVTNPELGPLGLQLLHNGRGAEDALAGILEHEAYPEWRQVLVLDAQGRSACHSGAETLGIHATRQGRDCVAGGNLLADTAVIDALVSTFEATTGELAQRLLAAMDAALDAGGEMGEIRSAGLRIMHEASWPVVDLRVDWHIAPLSELRMIWQHYRPQREAYVLRAVQPDQSPSYGVPGDQR